MDDEIANRILRLAVEKTRSKQKTMDIRNFDDELFETYLVEYVNSNNLSEEILLNAALNLIHKESEYEIKVGIEVLRIYPVCNDRVIKALLNIFDNISSTSSLFYDLIWFIDRCSSKELCDRLENSFVEIQGQKNIEHHSLLSLLSSLASVIYIIKKDVGAKLLYEVAEKDLHEAEHNGFCTSTTVAISSILRRTNDIHCLDGLLELVAKSEHRDLNDFIINELPSAIKRIVITDKDYITYKDIIDNFEKHAQDILRAV